MREAPERLYILWDEDDIDDWAAKDQEHLQGVFVCGIQALGGEKS